MTEDKANQPHPSYSALETKREVYRAVAGGTDAVRAAKEKFLPKYPAEQQAEYDARLGSSTIDGLVMGGEDQLTGSVFEGEIDVSKVSSSIKPLLENVDNKGNSFNVFARDAFKASFEGHSLILVDAPNGKAKDLAEEKALGLRPYLNLYHAGNVINWRYRVNPVSKQKELALLVLKEVSAEPKGRFGTEDVTRYRVFNCENGVVTWELWKEVTGADGKTKDVILEKRGVVEKVKQIPVAFVGEVTDDPKLLVESRLEIKAYQKESSFDVIEYLSIPTFYTKGYEQKAGDDPLKLGASAHVMLPLDGEVGYAQIDAGGHDTLKATIKDIKGYIKSRVNYTLDEAMKSPDKTATEVVTGEKNKQARLVVWADDLKDALELSLRYMSIFLGSDEKQEIVLKTKWLVAQEQAEEKKAADQEMHAANVAATAAKAQV